MVWVVEVTKLMSKHYSTRIEAVAMAFVDLAQTCDAGQILVHSRNCTVICICEPQAFDLGDGWTVKALCAWLEATDLYGVPKELC